MLQEINAKLDKKEAYQTKVNVQDLTHPPSNGIGTIKVRQS